MIAEATLFCKRRIKTLQIARHQSDCQNAIRRTESTGGGVEEWRRAKRYMAIFQNNNVINRTSRMTGFRDPPKKFRSNRI